MKNVFESISTYHRRKKKEILDLLKQGKLITTKEAPSSSNGTFWPSLLRIQNPNGECTFEPFVQCTVCHQILAYEPRNGTSTISYHVQNCIKKTVSNKEISIKKYLKKDATISLEDKQMITLACSKYCAFDMQSFNSVNGNGFQQLCQVLMDVGYKYGELKAPLPYATSLLPDPTNVSRKIHHLATEYRLKFIESLKEDFESVKLVGISSDYWKNTYTSDYYLTVNIHYTKDKKPVTFMLNTSIFIGSKTGEATVRTIKSILNSYGIDPDTMHIIYLTDNGSKFVSGLKSEVHLRCICHCINLVLQYSLGEACPKINLLIKECGELVTHFKRCELNALLPTTLKQQCETRWNSAYDMLHSIDSNFKYVEDLLFIRKEHTQIASEQLSADQQPTLHLVLPWINKLKSYCELKTSDSPVIKQVKKLMLEQIQEKICLITTIINNVYEQGGGKNGKRNKQCEISQSDILLEFAHVDEQESDDDDNYDEVQCYAKAKLSFAKDEPVLEWWDKWSLNYPKLSTLVKWLLGIPAGSGTSERIFSASGRVLEERRQNLSGDVVNDILFLRNFRNIY
ncbi:unnamed protein product [Rotaria magnacalcarata]|uniref:Transposase n=1 Tax=Rotaria magnacalcarata TaxID=392030 RepID=A0A816QWD8_9BILA|nr:unnamed protein product [Rotaria magnacalcarata]